MPLIPFLPSNSILASLKAARIPLPASFTPSVYLSISFNGKELIPGEEIIPEDAREEPVVRFMGDEPEKEEKYTVMLLDIDAPSTFDRKYSPWRHWVQPGLVPITISKLESLSRAASSDVQVDDSAPLTVEKTASAATSYRAPGPSEMSGIHRYVFLLYKQPETANITEETTGGHAFEQRRAWKHQEFVEANGLKLVAANWFKCRNIKDKNANFVGTNDFL